MSTQQASSQSVHARTKASSCTGTGWEESPVYTSGFEAAGDVSKFACCICDQNLEKITQLRKVNMRVEYENEKLKEQVHRLQRENEHLKKLVADSISAKLKQMPSSSFALSLKEDLEAELFECKFINQLLMLGQYPKSPPDLKARLEECTLEKLVMQEQLEQRNRIISERVLYPLYHFDSRLKNLREAVVYFHGVAVRECKKTQEMQKLLKKEVQVLTKHTRQEMEQLTCRLGSSQKENNSKNSLTNPKTVSMVECCATENRKDKDYPSPKEFEISVMNTKSRKEKAASKREHKSRGKKGEPGSKDNRTIQKGLKNVRLCCQKQV